MPPRYVYWTIIVDGQPTAFRSGSLEDIMPTFNRLKEKQPSAELKWFQNGQLWPSRHDAQDFMRARGERGRAKDPRQSKGDDSDVAAGFPVRRSLGEGGSRTDRPERTWNAKPDWKTRSSFSPKSDKPRVKRDEPAGERPAWAPKGAAPEREDVASGFSRSSGDKPEWKPKSNPAGQARSDRKPEWKPKGTFKPNEAGHASGWGEKPGWKPKSPEGRPFTGRREDKPSFAKASTYAKASVDKPEGKPEWKPKGTFKPKEEGHRPSARDQARSSFRPKSFTPKVDDGRTRSSRVQSRNDKLEWTPKGDARPAGPNAGFGRDKGGVASGASRSQSEGNDRPEGKRKWVPKAEYKKSLGIEAKRDDKWRPGGEHKDPKQKYKDAKKAKWTKFKANIRARSTKPRKPKDE